MIPNTNLTLTRLDAPSGEDPEGLLGPASVRLTLPQLSGCERR
jgi:hypothetical protein